MNSIVYDETRGGLLRGRSSMLALAAAQLKEQLKASGSDRAPIWVDLGGGTGNSICFFVPPSLLIKKMASISL